MSWTHELEQFVPTGSLKKGRSYFQSRAVLIHETSASRVEATIKRGGAYSVVIETHEDETIVVSCTCSYYDDSNICKHIWATLLEAESKNRPKKRRRPEPAPPAVEKARKPRWKKACRTP